MRYLAGAKLGDFIHSMIVPKYIYDTTGEKADIFLNEEGDKFTTGIDQTYTELVPIMLQQDFVNSFEYHDGEIVHHNLNEFRASPGLFRDGWSKIFLNQFCKVEPPKNYSWIILPHIPENTIVINRTTRHMSQNTRFLYETFLDNHKNVRFIYTNKEQLEAFPGNIESKECKTILDMTQEIANCHIFFGNQSFPLAMATALGKNILAELRDGPDAPHYREEMNYNTKLNCFTGD